MNVNFKYAKYQFFFDELFKSHSSACLCTAKGETVYLKYENLSDVGTLSASAQMNYECFPLKKNDIVISNDPYSGGGLLSQFTITIPLFPNREKVKGRSAEPLLLSLRISCKPHLTSAKTIEEEGVRIPPTPICQDGKVNHEVIEMIQNHPLSSREFSMLLLQAIDNIKILESKFMNMSQAGSLDWSRVAIKDYFKVTQDIIFKKLTDWPLGDAEAQLEFDKDKFLKVKLEINDSKVILDFSGSSIGDKLNITSGACYGACVGAFIAVVDLAIPINKGLFEVIEVVTPQKSVVDARYPSPVYFGMTDGVALVAQLVLEVIGTLDERKHLPKSGVSQCSFDLEFSKGVHFFETLESGIAATQSRNGQKGLYLWRRHSLDNQIEEIERRYPMSVASYSYRLNSGGGGKFSGGDGVSETIVLKKSAVLRWLVTDYFSKDSGSHGGKAALGPEIVLTRLEGQRERLSLTGELKLSKGDRISILSAGGGGFGTILHQEED